MSGPPTWCEADGWPLGWWIWKLSQVESQYHAEAHPDRRFPAAILLDPIRRLKPLDRQIILLYLEGEAAETTAEVTGLSAANIATKIHRIKRILKQLYLEGAADAGP